MTQSPQRMPILICSVLGVIAFVYFLLSPALMLPAEPEFSRLTIGKSALLIDGESRVALHGFHLVLQLTGLVNLLLVVLFTITTALILILSPFTALTSLRTLLTVLTFSAVANCIGLAGVITAFTPYLESTSIAAGVLSMILILVAVYLRKGELAATGRAQP
ncbi:hypothetical protein [Neptuniibacter halophilus]|uniref:hypothetical protein n=1 Tax=Neptuniibacter halophilus TaxID=651666 RepID=UPI002574073F|nr:hypothetical protein [Neptuniibacter halophilus]